MRPLPFVVSALLLSAFVAPSYAGVGGTPPPPRAGAEAAGKATDYCCARWNPQNDGSMNGQSCFAIGDTAQDRNSCTFALPPQANTLSGVAKCRGEVYDAGATTGGGAVRRCLTP